MLVSNLGDKKESNKALRLKCRTRLSLVLAKQCCIKNRTNKILFADNRDPKGKGVDHRNKETSDFESGVSRPMPLAQPSAKKVLIKKYLN